MRSVGNALSCCGARCWTRTRAKPGFGGNARTMLEKASRPPADAPTPTIVIPSASRVCARIDVTTWAPDEIAFACRRERPVLAGCTRRSDLDPADLGRVVFERVLVFFAIRGRQCYRSRGRLRRVDNSGGATKTSSCSSYKPGARSSRLARAGVVTQSGASVIDAVPHDPVSAQVTEVCWSRFAIPDECAHERDDDGTRDDQERLHATLLLSSIPQGR